jgi:hypothetical protein
MGADHQVQGTDRLPFRFQFSAVPNLAESPT